MSKQPSIITYQTLRRLIGIVAILHPIILYLGGKILFGIDLQPSMSHYYWTGMGDVFVGIVTATGVFFLCYRGYGLHDQIVALATGISAILVAMFPIPELPSDQLSGGQQYVGTVHVIGALGFLISIAYFCLVLFVKHTPDGMPSAKKKRRDLCYRILGGNIVVCILFVVIYGSVPAVNAALSEVPFVFGVEVIAFWSFGFAWLIKGEALLADGKNENKG